MSKQKQDKQGGGWQFPLPLEIIKFKEGNKEYMKERPARKPYGRIVKVCEFSLEAVAEFGDDDARAVWRLVKRAARDFLRVSWINTAIVTATKTDRSYMAVIVYVKILREQVEMNARIEIDYRKCANFENNSCRLYGKNANIAVEKCAKNGFKGYWKKITD